MTQDATERRLRLDNMQAMEGTWAVMRREWREDLPDIAKDGGFDTRVYPQGWALGRKLEEIRETKGDFRTKTMGEVMRVVCSVCGIDPRSIFSDSKQRYFSRRRAMVASIIREICPQCSLPMIGRFLNRDHTTIMHAMRKFPIYLENDPDLAAEFAECCRHFGIKP